MTLIVRRAVAADYPAWYDLRVAVAGEGIWIGVELPVPRDEDAFVARLPLDDVASFVADDDGTLVGAIGLEVHGGVVGFGMWVAASHRGQGVGRALVEASVAWAREVGAHKISIEAWPHNAAAIALYRSAGFEIEGRKRRHYRRRNGELWDSVLLGKVLDLDAPGSPHADA